MSDHRPSRRRDAGFSLPELLITIVVMGLVFGVISGTLIVTMRQQPATEGRLNVARAEQNVSMWIPSDLASASAVTTDPAASPCGDSCPPDLLLGLGSSAMMVSWAIELPDGTVVTTNVGYHFLPVTDDVGNVTYELVRVQCTSSGAGWSCNTITLMTDLPGPPGGETFVPGVTRPTWVIQVSQPLAPDATSEEQVAQPSTTFDARRVIVTINGGGPTAGAGGGVNQISITAGGTVRNEIDSSSLQGVPSFVEARSRCGGTMTLVVDESNSIGSAITQVRNAVRSFVETLAGTPVRLQIVGFHTQSRIIGGGSDWTRYYDMLEPADVAALVAAVPQLQGSWTATSARSGGTNWEDALFRTFLTPTGQLQQNLPDTVVFFTDGVPTYSRLDDPAYPAAVTRGSPGVLTGDPAAPGAPWPMPNGTGFFQVAFDRANHLATRFRSTVDFIGVGVGPDLSSTSAWTVDPGAGYHLTWERGSRTYQRATSWTTQSTWQTRPSASSSNWSNVTEQVYNSTPTNRRRIQWGTISTSLFNANNTTADDSDGYRRVSLGSWTWVSTAEYESAQGTINADIYRAVTKEWAAGPDWEPWTGTRPGSSSHYRSTKVYAPPYEDYDPPVTANTSNGVILARLVAGNDTGVPAQWNGSEYVNPEVADMYLSPQWSQLGSALRAVALGECGGTLTVQTRIDGTTPAPDPFTYQNSAVRDAGGNQLVIEPTVVRTNQQFIAGTFDFEIASGQFVDVDVLPVNLSDLVAYSPQGWSCRAGVTNRSVTPVPIADSPWSGIRVRVAANEAVSCTLSVSRN